MPKNIVINIMLVFLLLSINAEAGDMMINLSDYESFSDALEAVPDAGAEIFVPVGVFEIHDNTLLKNNLKIRGSGSGSVLKFIKNGPEKGWTNGIRIGNVKDVVIENLTIDGNFKNVTGKAAIFTLYSAERITLRNCNFINVAGDVYYCIKINNNVRNVRISGNNYEIDLRNQEPMTRAGNLIFCNHVTNSGDFIIKNNYFKQQGGWIYNAMLFNIGMDNVIIKNNIIYGDYEKQRDVGAISIAECENFSVIGNHINGFMEGIHVEQIGETFTIITGNNIQNCKAGLALSGPRIGNSQKGLVVSSNILSDCPSGISLIKVRGASINSNTIYNSNSGITLRRANDSVISANVILDCLQTGIFVQCASANIISENQISGTSAINKCKFGIYEDEKGGIISAENNLITNNNMSNISKLPILISGFDTQAIKNIPQKVERRKKPKILPPQKWSCSFEVPITVKIPAGKFISGKQNKEIILPDFAIGKYEVTASQFACFLNEQGNPDNRYLVDIEESTIEFFFNQYQPRTGMEKFPAFNVTWYGAVEYCKWLRQKTGQKFRLPTKDEWEKAARGTDGRPWPWGNENPIPEHLQEKIAKSIQTGDSFTTEYLRHYYDFGVHGFDVFLPINSLPSGKSPYGCFHMADNSPEWTSTEISGRRPIYWGPASEAKGHKSYFAHYGCWAHANMIYHHPYHFEAVLANCPSFGFRVAKDLD